MTLDGETLSTFTADDIGDLDENIESPFLQWFFVLDLYLAQLSPLFRAELV